MVSNCGHDERGRYSGGQAGDQSGTEWYIRPWYRYYAGWSCILRYPDAAVREKIASMAEAAARNNLIGYDQGQRSTFWEHLQASNYDPAQITIPCETDCSAGTSGIMKAAGIILKIKKLAAINQGMTTRNMRAAAKAAGFLVLTDQKYLVSADNLLRGDILLNDGHHVCINLTDGNKPAAPAPTQAAVSFAIGRTYTTAVVLNVRDAAAGSQKLRSQLTPDGQKNAMPGEYAELKAGTKVTLQAMKTVGSNLWGKIPSGWICLRYGTKYYVK